MSVSGSSPRTLAGQIAAVGEGHDHLLRIGDHMLVGQDDAVGPDDESCPVSLDDARALRNEEEVPW